MSLMTALLINEYGVGRRRKSRRRRWRRRRRIRRRERRHPGTNMISEQWFEHQNMNELYPLTSSQVTPLPLMMNCANNYVFVCFTVQYLHNEVLFSLNINFMWNSSEDSIFSKDMYFCLFERNKPFNKRFTRRKMKALQTDRRMDGRTDGPTLW